MSAPTYGNNIRHQKTVFLQMEAIFAVRPITSQRTEFAKVVQALQTRNIDEVVDILENVPGNDRYTALKKQSSRGSESLMKN